MDSSTPDRFQILARVSQQISSILDIDQLLTEVARLIQVTFDYHHVGIGLVEGDDVVYRVGAGELWERSDFRFSPARLKIGQEGIAGHVAATGKPHVARDVRIDPFYVKMEGSRTLSEMIMPMIIKGKVIGVLDVQSYKLDDFTETDIEMIGALANQAAVALDNARLFANEQRRVEQFRALNEVGRHIAALLEIETLLDQLVQSIQQAFNYYLVEIGLVENGRVVFKARSSRAANSSFSPFQLEIGQGITGQAVASNQPIVVSDVRHDERYLQFSHHETRSELAVPIQVKSRVIGVLNIQSDQYDAFEQSDVELMQALASQAGIAIENAQLYEQAKQIAVFEERQRLARELHDSITQSLYGMGMYAQAANAQLSKAEWSQVSKHIKQIEETAEEALTEMRLLLFELRPPVLEDEGLEAALQSRLSMVENRSGLQAEFNTTLTKRLPPLTEEILYRIAQEAFTNVLKHAHASKIQVSLNQENDQIIMGIKDDGVGFDNSSATQKGCLGLISMQERAEAAGGHLAVDSHTGSGTAIRVVVPIEIES